MQNSDHFAWHAAIFALLSVFLIRSSAWSQAPTSRLLVEAINVIHGVGGTNEQILGRLTENGKLAWENQELTAKDVRVVTLSEEQLASVKRHIDGIDWSKVSEKMGPYNTYTDSSVELRFRVAAPGGERRFSIINPWPCDLPSCSLGPKKPLPAEVKEIVCEIDRLHAQATNSKPDGMCVSR